MIIIDSRVEALQKAFWTSTRLQTEQAKLLQAHYADAIPLDILKQEQARISGQLAGIDHQTLTLNADKTKVADHLDFALNLLQDCYRLYTTSPDHLKKLLNNVFFEKILINPQDNPDTTTIQRTATPTLAPPFDNLVTIAQQKTSEDHSSEAQHNNIAAIVSSKTFVVALLELDFKKLSPLMEQLTLLRDSPNVPQQEPSFTRLDKRVRRSSLSPDQINQALTDYQNGASAKGICRQYGISRDYFNSLRCKHSIAARPKSISDQELTAAIHCYQQGQSLATIAKSYNTSAETLRQKFLKSNVELRPRNGWVR